MPFFAWSDTQCEPFFISPPRAKDAPYSLPRPASCFISGFLLAFALSGLLWATLHLLGLLTQPCRWTCQSTFRRCARHPYISPSPRLFPLIFRVGVVAFLSHGSLAAPSPAYNRKALERAELILSPGRGVLPKTDSNRQIRLEEVVSANGLDAECVNRLVIDFGQFLFRNGRPYGHFSELINAISSVRPILRKQLGGAWDLAYNWLALEPHVHHIALPGLVLIAMVTTCLVWGWTREAGLFALMWGGLCRPGEVITACRKHLVLPADVLGSQVFALLRIEEPKTRKRAARHQAAKVDLPDLLEVITIAFAGLEPAQRLWPYSGQTLRSRFQKVCETLGLPDGKRQGKKGLELGSFRPGGATWLLQNTENPDLVRRRGRWLSPRIMDIYLQEVEAATFLTEQSMDVRARVHYVASTFPAVLQKISLWHRAKIPATTWYWLCSSNREERRAGDAGKVGNISSFGQPKKSVQPNRLTHALRTKPLAQVKTSASD